MAHEVVRCNPRMPCDLLITYGSGLRKLGMLKRYLQPEEQQRSDATTVRAAAPRRPVRDWLDWLRGGLVLLCLPWLLWLADVALGLDASWPVLSGVLLIVGVACIGCWARRDGTRAGDSAQLRVERKLFHSQYELVNANTRWLDLYSSHDPVSNGPLLDRYQPDGLHTHEVRVFGSMFSDHTGYWRSKDDFLLGLTRELFMLDEGSPQEDTSSELDVQRARYGPFVAGDATASPGSPLRVVARWSSRPAAAAGFIVSPPTPYLRVAEVAAEPLGAIPWLGESLAGAWGDSLLAVFLAGVLGLASYALLVRLWGEWRRG